MMVPPSACATLRDAISQPVAGFRFEVVSTPLRAYSDVSWPAAFLAVAAQ